MISEVQIIGIVQRTEDRGEEYISVLYCPLRYLLSLKLEIRIISLETKPTYWARAKARHVHLHIQSNKCQALVYVIRI